MKLLNKPFRILLLVFLICQVQQLFAQIPQQINYQGALRDSKGNPIVNQQITLRLSIQDQGANGLVHYNEVRSVKTNAVGLYNVAIGSPGALDTKGNFSTIPWGMSSKFLKVEVDPEGGYNYMTAGLTQLLSVPYALYAKYAENGPVGPPGPAGADGSAILSGTTDPASGIGKPGDYYFNTTTNVLYGPQNPDGTWPSGTVLLQGPQGPSGPAGADGLSAYEIWQQLPGNDGKSLQEYLDGLKGVDGRSVTTAQLDAAGNLILSFSDNTTTNVGQVIGPAGPQGPTGPQGPAGFNCWDANLNGINDPSEDTNGDGMFNTLDCAAANSNPTLTDGHIFVGNPANFPGDVAMSGDATITNGGVVTVTNGAITLNKMANGAPNMMYTTDQLGKPQLTDPNLFAWTINGNKGTGSSNFIGTTDQQNLNFKVNNMPAGRLGYFDILTSYGNSAGSKVSGGGGSNLFMGYSAGREMTSATNTTIIGSSAGRNMGISVDNTFIGMSAGANAAIAQRNTYIGVNSGLNNVGSDNLFLGSNSGSASISEVSNSVFIGSESGTNIQAGNQLTNAVAIGYQSTVNANNSMVLGGTGSNMLNVGIGTTIPTERLDVNFGNFRLNEGVFKSEQRVEPTLTVINANGITGFFSGLNGAVRMTNVKGEITIDGENNTINWTQIKLSYTPFDAYFTPPAVLITPANATAADSEYFVRSTQSFFYLYYKNKTVGLRDAAFYYWVIQ